MAASAKKHSKLSIVKVDTSGGVLTEISDSCNKCEFPEELDLLDVTVFTATNKQYLAGFGDGKISMGGPWNRTLHTHLAAVKAAFIAGSIDTVSVEYGPEGSTAGSIKKTCEAVMTSYKVNSAIKDAVMWEAELQISGSVTETTY